MANIRPLYAAAATIDMVVRPTQVVVDEVTAKAYNIIHA